MNVSLPEFTFHGASSAEAMGETVPPSLARNNVPDLWSHWTGKGVRVGVLDTGVDGQHWQRGDLQDAIGAAKDFTGEGIDDGNGHGTHVAGTIGARRGNGFGITGVAPECALVIAKVLGSHGRGDDQWIEQGIDWCIEHKCDILNLSLGSSQRSPRIEAALIRAVAAEIIIVAAAGNESGGVGEPAARSYCICVNAVDENDALTGFSNYGPESDIAAPGKRIVSLYKGGDIATLSGTSMACPYVVGMLCIAIQSAREDARDINTTEEALDWLEACSDDVGQPGKDKKYGWGIISTKKMLAKTQESDDGLRLGPLTVHVPAQAGDLVSVGMLMNRRSA